MTFNFPRIKFADINTQTEQVLHILSEAGEVAKALIENKGIIAGEAELELMDLHHSLETFWRMRIQGHGEKYVNELIDKTVVKNTERGYYDIDGNIAIDPGQLV